MESEKVFFDNLLDSRLRIYLKGIDTLTEQIALRYVVPPDEAEGVYALTEHIRAELAKASVNGGAAKSLPAGRA